MAAAKVFHKAMQSKPRSHPYLAIYSWCIVSTAILLAGDRTKNCNTYIDVDLTSNTLATWVE